MKNFKHKIWVCSDLHFFHDNIIKHCNRPCTQEEHNEWILNKVNLNVGSNDIIYHVGDFAYGSKSKYPQLQDLFSKLNGNWRFILGNHDKENQLKSLCNNTKHKVVGPLEEFYYNDRLFVLFHYPIENWNGKHRGSIHLHGHIHNNEITPIKNRFNVCLDYEHKIYLLDDFIQ